MDEKQIFDALFTLAKGSEDPEGVVIAALTKGGKILLYSPGASDGIRHAEDLLIERAKKLNIKIDDSVLLVTTLEPCSYRNPSNKVKDCTTIILNAGIKNVLFAASDPDFSKEAETRFNRAGVNYKQVVNKEIIRRAIKLFDSTVKIPLTSMGIPRKKKLT